MPGGYRCSHGHTWTHAAVHIPTECPVCGDTVLASPDATIESEVPREAVVLAVQSGSAGGKDVTLHQSLPVARNPATPLPHATDSSLVPLPGKSVSASDLLGRYPDDVVPFGDGTTDFVPPLVPGYEILQEVGRGGMGVVYKARQLSLNRLVALKMILAGSHAGAAERDRFRREAEAVAALQNPHIVQIFEIGEANGHLYLALEFVEGGSLAQHLGGSLWPARDAADLIATIARAVQFAHSRGIVHRDLKPGNVLMGGRFGKPDGNGKAEKADAKGRTLVQASTKSIPKITDFGLAKRLGSSANPDGTKTGAVMGTPSYIAPEQASGKAREVGPAVDVYSLGAILYELLTGRPPFTGETPLETVLQVLNDDPVPPKRLQPGIPRDLETICLKCLDKNPAKRYASADALADDLDRFSSGKAIEARPLSAWGRGLKWAHRHPSLAVLGAVSIAATIALVSVLSVAYSRVKDAVEQKEIEANAARLAQKKEVEERQRAESLADENEKRRKEAVERNEELKREAERTRRSAYALQLAQVAAMCERDPHRALGLLDDTTRCPLELRDFTWAYLHRLCQREERVYLEHPPNDSLHAVAYSPMGTFAATAGDAGDIRVWDPRTNRTWAVLTGIVGRARGVAFSPDGEVIAAAGADRTIRFWELPVDVLAMARKTVNVLPMLQRIVKPITLNPAITLNGAHSSEVNCVAFSPDGRYLASGGEDGFLRWWDVWGWRAPNCEIGILGGAGAFAASSAHLRRSHEPRPVWEVRSLEAHPSGVLALGFSANGDVLVSGGADRTARVWAADGANLIRTLSGYPDAVLAVAASPDGKLIATVSNGSIPTIRLTNTATGREVRRLIGHTRSVFSLAISPDGELLASSGLDRTVRLWGVEDGLERGLLLGHDQGVSGLAFSPDRRSLISAGMDGTARVWQTSVRPYEVADVGRDATPAVATASASGTTIAIGDERGRVQVARSDSYQSRQTIASSKLPFQLVPIPIASPGNDPIRAVATSADGRVLLASSDKGLFVWQNFTSFGRLNGNGVPLSQRQPVVLKVPLPVYGLMVNPSGKWVGTLDREGIRQWSLAAVPAAPERSHPFVEPQGPGLLIRVANAWDFAFDPEGNRIAVAAENGVQIFDRSGKLLADLPNAHSSKIRAVAFGGKDGGLLASSDASGTVKVWRVGAGGELTAQAELLGHTGPVDALAFSPDARTLASGGYDRTVLLWDPMSGQERAVLTGHTDRILHVQFLPDASALIAVGRDGTARRWRADSAQIGQDNQNPPPLAALRLY